MGFAALARLFAAGIAVAGLVIGVCAPSAQAQQGEVSVTCTNPLSGANWQLKINYDRHTVDGRPAEITERWISWYQAEEHGKYTLDRKSGELTVVTPSTTGGYFLYDHCKP
jgi:hypothetical protein